MKPEVQIPVDTPTGDREMRQERGSKTGFARCC